MTAPMGVLPARQSFIPMRMVLLKQSPLSGEEFIREPAVDARHFNRFFSIKLLVEEC